MGLWNGFFTNYKQPDNLEVWDNRPGGTVVEHVNLDGTDYVYVEFKNTPGVRYLFLAP